jgi:hypothetical protein
LKEIPGALALLFLSLSFSHMVKRWTYLLHHKLLPWYTVPQPVVDWDLQNLTKINLPSS